MSVAPGTIIVPLLDRFWTKVEVRGEDECWPWTGAITDVGYGHLRLGGRDAPLVYAHRLAYEMQAEPIPAGMTLDHTCHTNDFACPGGPTCPHRRCVNPKHLEVVSRAENVRRGNARRAA